MKRLILAGLLALSLGGSVMAAPAPKLVAVFNTQLRAEHETTPSTSVAWGAAQIKVYDNGVIAWKVKFHNSAGEEFSAGPIHEAPAGDPGPVSQGLFGGPATGTKHLDFRGAVSKPTLATALVANPGNYYVNFHTRDNGMGAIRGQLP